MAEKVTAAVGQPLALADRNAGREGLAATRGHGEAMTEGSRLVAFAASALAMKPFGRAMRAPTSKTVAWWDVGADAHIGPNPPEAGLFEEGTLAAQARRAADSRPYGTFRGGTPIHDQTYRPSLRGGIKKQTR